MAVVNVEEPNKHERKILNKIADTVAVDAEAVWRIYCALKWKTFEGDLWHIAVLLKQEREKKGE